MASNIPTRRPARATRTLSTAAAKDDENIHARPNRLNTRAKATSGAGAAGASSRAANGVDAAAQGKRKREALGEVTTKVTNNKPKASLAKGKEKDTAADLKPAKSSTDARAVLRTVADKTKSSNVPGVKKEGGIKQEDAMAIDFPDLPPVPVVLVPPMPGIRKVSTKTSKSNASSRTTLHNRPALQVIREHKVEKVEKVEVIEDEPAFKRRRTSSEVGEEVQVEVGESEDVDAGISEFLSEPAKYEQTDDEELQDWIDIDKDDFEDTTMVAEYVNDIFKYLKDVESVTMPNPNYMRNQKELTWKMRGILLDWLIQVHGRFRLSPETLYLCINIIDRFLSARVVSLAKLQLVGVTCMFIAAKVEEMIAPTVSNFVQCADSTYKENEIIQAEKYILKTIDYNVSYPSPLNFLRRISKADDFNVEVRTLGKFLLEVGFMEFKLLAAPPSLLAAAAMWLARLIREHIEWTPTLRHYSTYTESSLLPTANLMLRYVLKDTGHESFLKKYASKRFMKASLVVLMWAQELWDSFEEVNLIDQVNDIKAGIRMKKKLREQGLLHDIHPLERLMRMEDPPSQILEAPQIPEDAHAHTTTGTSTNRNNAA